MDLRRQYKLIFPLRLNKLSLQLISIILVVEICCAKVESQTTTRHPTTTKPPNSNSNRTDAENKNGPDDKLKEPLGARIDDVQDDYYDYPDFSARAGTEHLYPSIKGDLYFTEKDKRYSTTRSPKLLKSIRKFHHYLGRKVENEDDIKYDLNTIPEDIRDDYGKREDRLAAVMDKAKFLLSNNDYRI